MSAPIPQIRLEKAIAFFGGARPLATFLDVSPEAIYKLVRIEEAYLPSLRAFQIKGVHPELIEAEPKPSSKKKAKSKGKAKSKAKSKAA